MALVANRSGSPLARLAGLVFVLVTVVTLALPSVAAAQSGGSEISTPRVDESVTLDQGTLIEWDSDDWQINEGQDNDTVLELESGEAVISLAEQAEGRSLEEAWQIRKGRTMEAGGMPLDTDQQPDGGWYGLWISPETGNYVLQTVDYVPGSDVIMSVLLIAPERDLEEILLERQPVLNGESVVWPDADVDALMGIYAEGGPIGDAPFVALAPASGLVADDTYVSPQFGYEITWSGGWAADEDLEISDPDEGYDSLSLSTVSPGSGGISILGGEWDGTTTVRQVLDYWVSDEYLEAYHPEGTEVVFVEGGRRTGAVVLYLDDGGEEWVTLLEVAIVDSTWQVNTALAAPVDDFEVVYEDAQENIALEGDSVVGYLTADEILDALP